VSPIFRRHQDAAPHERARELAALRLDEPLPIGDVAWLEDHLAGCPDCTAAAAAYDEGRLAFRAMRDAPPQPPRDLWARTAAAIELGAGPATPGLRRSGSGRWHLPLAPIAGIAVLVFALGVGLLNGGTVLLPGGSAANVAAATPIAVAAGDVRMLTHSGDGTLTSQTLRVDAVCPLAASSCGVRPSYQVSHVPGIDTSAGVDAILSPSQDRIVVVERGDGARGIFVVPMATATAAPTPSGTRAASGTQ
jgi:hypothetical protein